MIKNVVYVPTVTLDQVEREYIERAVEHFGGNRYKAAKALGISTKTLYNKLDRYSGEFKYTTNWKLKPFESTDLPQGKATE